jgi:dTDP-4-dehydrorhamnose 3,5-epimerase
MKEGIIIKPLQKRQDERGFFTEMFRKDWLDLFQNNTVSQANLSISYPNIIRAWHRHLKGQIDYFIVIRGAIKICVYDEDKKELTEIVSTGENPQIVKVPGHYWHGFKVIGVEPAYLLYFVNKLYHYKEPDEDRRPWDDPNIIPHLINGKINDPRVGKPWNWNYPPNR